MHELAGQQGWFEDWSRDHGPGTRRTSRSLAIAWLWTHIALGHLRTSPGWGGHHPTPAQRRGYRQFEASLTRDQALRLKDLASVGHDGALTAHDVGDSHGTGRSP
jgi:hypothetical protein